MDLAQLKFTLKINTSVQFAEVWVKQNLVGTTHQVCSLKNINEKGYSQVLWLDGVEQQYLEEVGAMNIFFVKNGELYTPKLNGSLLPGVTRKSIIEFARDRGYTVHEGRIHIDDFKKGLEDGSVTEVFGAGTAAVVAPVSHLNIHGEELQVGDGEVGPVAKEVYDTLTGIQTKRVEDKFNWVKEVKYNKRKRRYNVTPFSLFFFATCVI